MKKHTATVPQLTPRAIVLAVVLAAILAAANVYIGLFAGTTIASAIPAAVVSMAVLRGLGGGGILENNIVSTGASAGCSIASGAIFTLPALIFMGAWQSFNFWWVCAITGLGGLLGVLFSVPLRRSLVVEQQMSFPEGRAAAEVLKAGMPGYPFSPNRTTLYTHPEVTPRFVSLGIQQRPACLCTARSASVHKQMIAGTRYERLSLEQ